MTGEWFVLKNVLLIGSSFWQFLWYQSWETLPRKNPCTIAKIPLACSSSDGYNETNDARKGKPPAEAARPHMTVEVFLFFARHADAWIRLAWGRIFPGIVNTFCRKIRESSKNRPRFSKNVPGAPSPVASRRQSCIMALPLAALKLDEFVVFISPCLRTCIMALPLAALKLHLDVDPILKSIPCIMALPLAALKLIKISYIFRSFWLASWHCRLRHWNTETEPQLIPVDEVLHHGIAACGIETDKYWKSIPPWLLHHGIAACGIETFLRDFMWFDKRCPWWSRFTQ